MSRFRLGVYSETMCSSPPAPSTPQSARFRYTCLGSLIIETFEANGLQASGRPAGKASFQECESGQSWMWVITVENQSTQNSNELICSRMCKPSVPLRDEQLINTYSSKIIGETSFVFVANHPEHKLAVDRTLRWMTGTMELGERATSRSPSYDFSRDKPCHRLKGKWNYLIGHMLCHQKTTVSVSVALEDLLYSVG
ncbi:hypothetical protein IF1G_10747 [Cordyceps javanica]|uniref:Uncharacterized protein n=1 Tax=Cordyceps javanica TaxID=43265 RepID=A0A545UM99_9HYPO|nr:hypothetical protein IF1G_10747 [Cordyceps javanica]